MRKGNAYRVFVEKPELKRFLLDLGIEGNAVLKLGYF